MVKIGDWFSEAWQLISQDIGTHLILGLIVGLGTSATGSLLYGPLVGGYLWIVFRKLKDPNYVPQVGDLAKGFEVFVATFLVWLVGGIIAGLGVIACVIGVFFTAALVILALPLVVEGGLAFWPAITTSINKTKENLFSWVLFVLVIALVNGLGSSVTAGIGMIITIPITTVMLALAYRDNFGLAGEAAAAPTASPTATPPSQPG